MKYPDAATETVSAKKLLGDKFMKNPPAIRRRMVLAAAALAWAGCVWAQEAKPLRLIVPLTTGSAVDALARALTPALIKAFNRPVFVENLAGAGGTTGTLQVVKSPKDGTTLGLVASGHVINPYIFKTMPFDAVKDITPISVLAYSPLVLVVNPSVPAKDQHELIALLKANPNKFNYGSAGNGSVAQLAASLFAKEAGVAIQHVPYRGVGPLMTDLIGGQVQMAFIGTSAAQPQVAAGKLRAIGVSSTTRAALMPSVPTIAEGGLGGFHYEPWIAAIGPAGLSTQQTAALAAGFKAAISAPSVREVLASQGFVTVANSPEQAAAFISSEFKRHEKLVKDSGALLE
jgi:tripartite-type tricarboxylate transporter receptor subunit TctC